MTMPTTPSAVSHSSLPLAQRWRAMWILCLATLMIVLDTTVVNVALPSIQADLGFSPANLAWVVNAYLLTFGGFLLLSGRLGDLYGQRPLFLGGLVVFVLASLACGLATDQTAMIVARAVQGLSGAMVDALALAMVMSLFTEPSERAKAMGVYGFVAAGGGAVGVLLGGVITQWFSWPWIFFINLPVGLLVWVMAKQDLPVSPRGEHKTSVDIGGAVTITASLMLAVYAIVNTQIYGWNSPHTVWGLLAALVSFVAFVWIEKTVANPLILLHLLKKRNVAVANVVAVLWAGGMFAWFFLAALFLQQVWHYSPLAVGLTFLPANAVMALFSLMLSAKAVAKFGIRHTVALGALLMTLSLFVFAAAPINNHTTADFLLWVLPSMVVLGVGCGLMMNPIMLAAMDDLPETEAGLASGVVSTAFMMGGALGLAILASIAAEPEIIGTPLDAHAVAVGYQRAFFWAGWVCLLATALALFGLKKRVSGMAPKAGA